MVVTVTSGATPGEMSGGCNPTKPWFSCLPATKEKLVRQVLVQEEDGFIQVQQDMRDWWTPVSENISSSYSGPQFSQGWGGEGFFPPFNYLVNFWVLGGVAEGRLLSIQLCSFQSLV